MVYQYSKINLTLPTKQSLKKEERLKSKKIITLLFEKGKSVTLFPLKIIWLSVPPVSQYPVNVAFSVPKKRFKRAVDRNRIKRQIRESYRLNKRLLYQHCTNKKDQIAMMIIFQGREFLAYKEINNAMCACLEKLILNHEADSSNSR